MNLREKYGEWGIILGATEGVGKAFAESDCTDAIFEATKDLDMGFMSYVACFLHSVSFRILPGRSMKP